MLGQLSVLNIFLILRVRVKLTCASFLSYTAQYIIMNKQASLTEYLGE